MDLIRVFSEASPTLLKGLSTTIQITCYSLVLALVIGVFACLFGISRIKPLQWITKFYIFFATPILLKMVFNADIRIDVFTASLITLTLNAGAYMSEIFRGAIESVNKGQMEAARSLGLSYSKAMVKIILPQAVRICLPSLVNQCIITLKDSTILYAIGLQEVMYYGKIYVGRTYETLATYTLIALFFLVIISILTIVSRYVERRIKY